MVKIKNPFFHTGRAYSIVFLYVDNSKERTKFGLVFISKYGIFYNKNPVYIKISIYSEQLENWCSFGHDNYKINGEKSAQLDIP